MSEDWVRLYDLDATLQERRDAIERLHREKVIEALQEWIDEGVMPAEALETATAKAMAAVQPIVDRDFAEFVGRGALN